MEEIDIKIMLNRIKETMAEKNISQYRLIKEKIVRRATFSDWSNYKYKPTIDILFKLAVFFNVSIDYLTGRTDVR